MKSKGIKLVTSASSLVTSASGLVTSTGDLASGMQLPQQFR